MIALVCPNCGGPLPAAAATMPQVTCGFCSTTLAPAGRDFRKVGAATAAEDDRPSPRVGFYKAMQAGIPDTSREPAEVLETAIREHYGLGSESEVVAAVALGLAGELREDTGIDVSRDAITLSRFVESYMAATQELGRSGAASMNLPFIAADSSGPKHFARELTIPDVQALARGERAPSRGAPPAPAPAATASRSVEPVGDAPTEKKWWWPF